MTVDDVLNYFGSAYEMKKQVGLSPSNIKNWLSYGYVPFRSQIKLQRLTNGALKVDNEALDIEMEQAKNKKRIKKKRGYEFSMDHYTELYEKQNGLCAICNERETRIDYRTGKVVLFCFDHDHETGKPRGLLCARCNRMIGFCKDNPVILNNAVLYLKKHSN